MSKINRDEVLKFIDSIKLNGMQVSELSKDENLIDQGIDSLDVMDILYKIEKKLSMKLPESASLGSINEIVEFLAEP